MTETWKDGQTFLYIGTADYHFMILKNIELLRRVYPEADVVVYDWGDGDGGRSDTVFPKKVEVIDWADRVKDTWPLMEIYNEKRQIEIGKSVNSRQDGTFSRRFNKFFLKRFPHSRIARKVVERGIRYENMLMHKSYNMQDCSQRLAGKPFFLLDADAYLVDRIDEVFDGDPDVILPMIDPAIHDWDYNNCHGLSTGVMGFNGSGDARDAFLSEWYAAIERNDEVLRELAAVNRLVKAKDAKLFDGLGLNTLTFEGRKVKIRTIENNVYNCYFNYQDTPADFDRVKILHLAGIVQRKRLFPKFIGAVEEVLNKRLENM